MASEIKVDTIVNAGGDNDSGIDLATNDNIKFDIAGAEKARVDSSGDFFIGKTSATIATDGLQFASGALGLTRDGDTPLSLNRRSSDGSVQDFRKDGSTVGDIRCVASNLHIQGITSGLSFQSNDVITPVKNGARTDNVIDLGDSSRRFNDAFITNGVTTSSDQNEKQDIASATAKELNVAKKLSTLFKTYRWKDAVAEKGDKARTHTGIIAQEIQSAFSAEGLDASNYGLFTSDTWTNDDGKEQTRLGVRYPELFSFIFSSIEARLTALESK